MPRHRLLFIEDARTSATREHGNELHLSVMAAGNDSAG